MTVVSARELAAVGWFGYGRWDAPYWFVGPESAAFDHARPYEAWVSLGANELVDARDLERTHVGATNVSWHRNVSPERRTSRALVRMAMAFEGRDPDDLAAVERFEDEAWGRAAGSTAVVELSAIGARTMSEPERIRVAHVRERIATIRERLASHRPKLVVFYGADYVEYWTETIGRRPSIGVPMLVDGTVVVFERHPVGDGMTDDRWIALGRKARALALY